MAGSPVIVTRSRQGALRGFHNVCRHRGTKLLDGISALGRNRRIRCPYHSWTYDLDGRCLGTPLFEGSDIPEEQQGVLDMSDVREFDKADYSLLPVRVEAWGLLVFANLDPNAAPLVEQLGDLRQRLNDYRLPEWQVMRRRRYDVSANYKLIGENFMEYYHLPWVHKELIQVSRLEDHYRWQGAECTPACAPPPSTQHRRRGLGGTAVSARPG